MERIIESLQNKIHGVSLDIDDLKIKVGYLPETEEIKRDPMAEELAKNQKESISMTLSRMRHAQEILEEIQINLYELNNYR